VTAPNVDNSLPGDLCVGVAQIGQFNASKSGKNRWKASRQWSIKYLLRFL